VLAPDDIGLPYPTGVDNAGLASLDDFWCLGYYRQCASYNAAVSDDGARPCSSKKRSLMDLDFAFHLDVLPVPFKLDCLDL
jgi:hypothetical protein